MKIAENNIALFLSHNEVTLKIIIIVIISFHDKSIKCLLIPMNKIS